LQDRHQPRRLGPFADTLSRNKAGIPVTPTDSTPANVSSSGKDLSAVFEWAGVVLTIGTYLFWFRPILDGDGHLRFQFLHHLFENGRAFEMKYSALGPLLATPLYFLGKVVQSPEWWCARFNLVVFFGACGALYGLLRNSSGPALARRFVLLLLVASMYPNHVQQFYGEVLSSTTAGIGLFLLATGQAILAWPLLAVGLVNTPATAVAIGAAVLALCLRTRRLGPLLIFGALCSLVCVEAWLRFGRWVPGGYDHDAGYATLLPYSGRPGFSYPMVFGVLSLLFSFGKGLVFFAPGAFLDMPARNDNPPHSTFVFLARWYLVGLVLVYSGWWSWYGGYFWGPRFLLFASIPAALILAERSLRASEHPLRFNFLTLAALIWSVWVGMDGAMFDQQNMGICEKNNYALESFCWYLPEFSALFRPFVVLQEIPAAYVVPLLLMATAGLTMVGPLAWTCILQLRAWMLLRSGYSRPGS